MRARKEMEQSCCKGTFVNEDFGVFIHLLILVTLTTAHHDEWIIITTTHQLSRVNRV
jgi:hypothetical protein